MAVTYQLNNQNNWEEVWTSSVTAQRLSDTRYVPISDLICPVLLTSNVIAIYCDSQSKKAYYKRGGYVRQKFSTGLTVGGTPDSYSFQKGQVWLGQISIVNFPELATEYALVLKPPYWLEDISFKVWQYTGAATDSIEQSLIRIEEALAEPR